MELASDTCNTVGKLQNNYVEWKKLPPIPTKQYILYKDSTYIKF